MSTGEAAQGPNAFSLVLPTTATPGGATTAPATRASRDDRIDVLRGLVILAILVDHLPVPSLYRVLTVEAVGPVTGAEAFVLLSGVVLGLTSRTRLEALGWRAARTRLLVRARTLYLAALVANVLVFLLSRVPGAHPDSLTTWTDPATREPFSLYGQHPALPDLALGLLTLTYGPAQINVLGLYVALLLLAPAALALLARRRWLPLLALSWALLLLHGAWPARLLPFQSEGPFPLMAWQALFVHGLVLGWHRRELGAFAGTRAGRAVLGAATLVALLGCLLALNNPWVEVPLHARLHLVPEPVYRWLYGHLFERANLGVGRLVDTLALFATLYWLLTRATGARRALTPVLAPLGRATLYVFLVHLVFVWIAARVDAARPVGTLGGTVLATLVMVAVWLMVRGRVMFRWIPR